MNEQLAAKLERIKAACRKAIEFGENATSGPWSQSEVEDGRWINNSQKASEGYRLICAMSGSDYQRDAAWIKHARTFSPAAAQALLTAIEALERADSRPTTDLLQSIADQWPEESL